MIERTELFTVKIIMVILASCVLVFLQALNPDLSKMLHEREMHKD